METVNVNKKILSKNDIVAHRLRQLFEEKNIAVFIGELEDIPEMVACL